MSGGVDKQQVMARTSKQGRIKTKLSLVHVIHINVVYNKVIFLILKPVFPTSQESGVTI